MFYNWLENVYGLKDIWFLLLAPLDPYSKGPVPFSWCHIKGRPKLHHFCSTCYHNIFMSKELSMKDIKIIGRFFKLHFRALPRFGAFWAGDLRLISYKLQSFVYLPWKFEEDILCSYGDHCCTKWDSENQKIVNISDRKWRHHTKNYFRSF